MSTTQDYNLFQYSEIINIMCEAAFAAGKILVHDLNEVQQLQVSAKGPANFVSNADRRAERAIKYKLLQARPQYGYIMEESGLCEGEDPNCYWIVDPLDGTTNFLHSIPHFAISIALQKHNEIVAGLVFNPIMNEVFWAEKGKGAFSFLNARRNQRLKVSARTNLRESLVGNNLPALGNKNLEIIHNYYKLNQTLSMRHYGAAALDLCYVAAGRLEGFWEFQLGVWDVAAGSLIVKEAGGKITDCQGQEMNFYRAPESKRIEKYDVLATNNYLHQPLLNLIQIPTTSEER